MSRTYRTPTAKQSHHVKAAASVKATQRRLGFATTTADLACEMPGQHDGPTVLIPIRGLQPVEYPAVCMGHRLTL